MWKTLRRNVSENILVWDTNTVPNATYFVKVVASDGPSNPAGTALTGELESSAFDIDNTPPVITITSVRFDRGRPRARGRGRRSGPPSPSPASPPRPGPGKNREYATRPQREG